MLLMIDNYDSFTYNLVQYLGELGEDVPDGAQRPDHRSGDRRIGADADRVLARSLRAGCGRHHAGRDRGVRRKGTAARRLPRSPGDRAGVRRTSHQGPPRDARQDRPGRTHGRRHLHRAAGWFPGRSLPFTGRRRGVAAVVPGDHRPDAGRRDHGAAAPRVRGPRRPVPPGVARERAWPCHAREIS